MSYKSDLHLARRLQEAVGNEATEDILAAALTVSTCAICYDRGVSAARNVEACGRFRALFTEAVAVFMRELEENRDRN